MEVYVCSDVLRSEITGWKVSARRNGVVVLTREDKVIRHHGNQSHVLDSLPILVLVFDEYSLPQQSQKGSANLFSSVYLY